MDPMVVDSIAPVLAIAIGGLVVSIPLIGLTARLAAKPVIEALIRYKEAQIQSSLSDETLRLQDRRLSLLEAELGHMQNSLDRLAEAEQFRAQLEQPRRPELPREIA